MTQSMHYKIKGNGRPLLFVHGWAMQSGVWDGLVDKLSSAYCVITVDLRGHGKSASMSGPYTYEMFSKDIAALIFDLGLRDLTLVGWSMGVQVVLTMLAEPGLSLSGLVFISGNPSLVKRDGYDGGLPPAVVRRLLRQVERDYTKGLQSFYDQLFTPEELSLLKVAGRCLELVDSDARPARQAALESLGCLYREDLRHLLSGIRQPTLIVHGGEDQICVPSAGHYMHRVLSGSELLMLEGAGHMPFVTREAEVTGAIRRFVDHL